MQDCVTISWIILAFDWGKLQLPALQRRVFSVFEFIILSQSAQSGTLLWRAERQGGAGL